MRTLLLGLVAACGAVPTGTAVGQTIRPVVLSSDQAVGGLPGTRYGGLSVPSINSAGEVLFHGQIRTAQGSYLTDAIWLADSHHTVGLVVRKDDPAPGTPDGVVFDRWHDAGPGPFQDSSADVGFAARVKGPGVTSANAWGIWAGGVGSVGLVARAGDPAPGTISGVVFTTPLDLADNIAMSRSGTVAFAGSLSGPGVTSANRNGIWVGTPGNVSLLARNGDPAPGGVPGETFVSIHVPRINESGTAVFAAFTGQEGAFVGTPGNVSRAVGYQDDLGALGAGIKVRRTYEPTINKHGTVGVAVQIDGPGVNASNNTALVLTSPSGLVPVIRSGDHAPGTETGTAFGSLAFEAICRLNDAGRVALRTFVTGPTITFDNDCGIWTNSAGSMRLVAREASHAPGTGAGVVFEQMQDPAFNLSGQLAFISPLSGTGVNSTNDIGIWATDPSGELRLVVREGGTIETEPGVFRTITELHFTGDSPSDAGGAEGLRSGLNDRGELAFWARYEGGEGIFLAMVPAPGVLGLAAAGLAAVARRRR